MNLLDANDGTADYPASWYAATAAPPAPYPRLEGTARADVAVVGGGYTGLSAALHAARAGLSVTLVEARRIGWGASGRNGGQVGTGQRLGQERLERLVGAADARRLWDLAEEAKALVRGLIAAHDIAADWRDGVAHAAWTAAGARRLAAEARHLADRYGYGAIETPEPDAFAALVRSPAYRGGTIDRGAGHIHPLRFALGLARAAEAAGARLHEASRATRIHPGRRPAVETAAGRIEAGQVILAGNGYLGALCPAVAARVMPINNFIVATEPLGERLAEVLAAPVAVADDRFVLNYFRPTPDGRLLFGGGETYGWRFPADIAGLVRRPLERVFPQLGGVRLTHAWGGTLAITMSRLPHLARPAPGVLSAGGYSGHGVALATLAGRLLAEAAAGQAGRFDLMARLPVPAFPGGAALRHPLLVLAMSWYALRDRLGV
ncbi:MAG: FAD-binding oxidoreductase [Rhodobacteraceae bacterium]|nr:FAD-binding oxidoreductase [Paracoccaceae bacterium]